jgi:hypothetical protein
LNSAQLDLLRWVADGCADGVYDGYTYRISAAALQSRGLLRISGRGPSWRAELTARGVALLALPAPTRHELRATAQPAQATKSAKAPAPSKTEQLIADLVAAGGVLRVPYWREDGRPDYRQRALAAQRFGKVPLDKRLVMEHVRGGQLELRLEDALPEPTVVSVPARVSRPHPAAARYRDDTDHHQVSRRQLPRSVRIVHALVAEALRRGHQVDNPKRAQRERSVRDSAKEAVAHLVIEVGGHSYSLNIAEEKVLLRGVWEERKRTREEHRRLYPLYGGHERLKPYDSEATGLLSISLLASGYRREGRAVAWSDRKSWKLEDKLGELLQELELRAVEDDKREAEEKRQAEDRQRQWELAIEGAKQRFHEVQRANVLRAQVAARAEAKVMADYLAELEQSHGESPESAAWIEWVRGFIARVDPLASPPTMPEEREVSREDLKPFLPQGVSPYGPQGW